MKAVIIKGSRVFLIAVVLAETLKSSVKFNITITNVGNDRSLEFSTSQKGKSKTMTEPKIREAVAAYIQGANVKRIISLNGYSKFGDVAAPKFVANFWTNGQDISVLAEKKKAKVAALVAKANGEEVAEVVTTEPPSASKKPTNTASLTAEDIAKIATEAALAAVKAVTA